jgi:hypothetical protein
MNESKKRGVVNQLLRKKNMMKMKTTMGLLMMKMEILMVWILIFLEMRMMKNNF